MLSSKGNMSKTDMGDEPEERKQYGYCWKILQTAFLCAVMLGMGACLVMRAPTLLDLQVLTGTSIQNVSMAVFTSISFGWLIGAFVGGVLFDKCNKQLVVFCSVALTAVAMAATPWCSHIGALATVLLLLGVFNGSSVTGSIAMTLAIWKENSGPYVQAADLFFAVGGIMAPIIAEPFVLLMDEPTTPNATINETAVPLALNKTNNIETKPTSMFFIAYSIVAVYALLTALPFGINFLTKVQITTDMAADYLQKTKRQGTRSNLKLKVQITAFGFGLFFLYTGYQEAFAGFIPTFAIMYLNWDKSATLLPTVFWASYAASRLLGIFVARCIRPGIILLVVFVIQSVTLLILIFTVSIDPAALWACTAIVGAACAPVYANLVTWTDFYIEATGTIMAILHIGVGAGSMAIPALAGFLLENKGPMWLIYISLGGAVISFVLFLVMSILNRSNQGRFAREEEVDGETEPLPNGTEMITFKPPSEQK